MPLSQAELRTRAEQFSREWSTARRERAEAQTFWNEFFNIFGISRRRVATFEEPVRLLGERRGSIDLFWPGTLIVEHKSAGEDLDRAYQQAIDYFPGIEEAKLPKYVLVSDFRRFRLHDLESDEERDFTLAQLSQNLHYFGFITGYQRRKVPDTDPVNVEAALRVGALHDRLYASGFRGHVLEIFLVRIVYCLFADKTGIFQNRDQFYYLVQERTLPDGSNLGPELSYLFQILNTPHEQRAGNLDEDLRTLTYVNGGLFADVLPIPTFDIHTRNDLFACFNFDWSLVSPAIFGSMFEAVMSNDQEKRHSLGAHYTSEANILKVLNGLFLDDLHSEFQRVRDDARRLRALKDQIAELKLFDPACGCGNFLVVAYRELRLLEIEILKRIVELQPQTISDVTILCRVDVDQVTGIEIEENPAAIAEVALWITDHQMNQELSDTFGRSLTRLPLLRSARILRANALRTNWSELFETSDLVAGRVMVFGNPPFVAKANRTDAQNADHDRVWGNLRGHGILDYVTCWFAKAAEFLDGTRARAAFVATNSITQGEQVGVLWPALHQRGLRIFFAHRTFRWTSESRDQAAVFCVVIGVTMQEVAAKYIFDYESPDSPPHVARVTRINPYLIEEDESLVVTARSAPLCDVPQIRFGSMPNDGGGLLFSQNEHDVFLRQEPGAGRYIRRFVGSEEFLSGVQRYCLWLRDAEPRDLRTLPRVLARLDAVAQHRHASRRPQTQELAARPALFGEDRQPGGRYILIPSVSSERRRYIPMAIMQPSVIASNLCLTIESDDLYTLGVLSSAMHMAWVGTVAGRLEGRYRYSNQIVYNNFPWPLQATDNQRERVRQGINDVLDARARYPQSSLSDLYDPRTMPTDLTTAHRSLDRAVDRCYRQATFDSDVERFQHLIRLYSGLLAPLMPQRRRRAARPGA